jgi:hypothetical protein
MVRDFPLGTSKLVSGAPDHAYWCHLQRKVIINMKKWLEDVKEWLISLSLLVAICLLVFSTIMYWFGFFTGKQALTISGEVIFEEAQTGRTIETDANQVTEAILNQQEDVFYFTINHPESETQIKDIAVKVHQTYALSRQQMNTSCRVDYQLMQKNITNQTKDKTTFELDHHQCLSALDVLGYKIKSFFQ